MRLAQGGRYRHSSRQTDFGRQQVCFRAGDSEQEPENAGEGCRFGAGGARDQGQRQLRLHAQEQNEGKEAKGKAREGDGGQRQHANGGSASTDPGGQAAGATSRRTTHFEATGGRSGRMTWNGTMGIGSRRSLPIS